VATKVYLEIGSKRVFACSLDWPGWARSGKDEEAALARLADYADRYAPVATAAGVRFPKNAADDFEIVERRPGSGATDFGVLDKPAAADGQALSRAQAERLAALVEASWRFFDGVVAQAPAELRKGPRGGGRDRDKIVDHVVGSEVAYVRMIGLRFKESDVADAEGVARMRSAILETLRSARDAVPPDLAKGWPYRYAARRIAWHVLDHAWEIQDRST
jgi:hypothetical protein